MSNKGVYIHAKPDATPFYVGKGARYRMGAMTRRNDWHMKTINKYGKENILKSFIECSSESIALELEIGLIKTLRQNGYDLVNMTDGGEGPTGYRHTPETIEAIAAKNRGRKQSEEERNYRSSVLKGIPKSFRTAQHKKNLGDAIAGRKWYNNGTHVVFCYEGNQPDGYILGRGNKYMISQKTEAKKCHA